MRKFKKVLAVLLFVVLITFPSCSNDKNAERLLVRSTDYPKITLLHSAKLNADKLETMRFDEAYSGVACFVSKSNHYSGLRSALIINNDRDKHISAAYGNNGYFIGMNYSEFASGLYFYHYSGITSICDGKVTDDICVALLPVTEQTDGHIKTNKKYCYAVTAWNYNTPDKTYSTTVYKLVFPTSDELTFKAESVCEIPYQAVAAAGFDGKIYIAMYDALYEVTYDGNYQKKDVPEEWSLLGINSMTELNGELFFGSAFGVLKYSPASDIFTWFPLDYDKILN